jgi:hypothetical protein
LLCIKPKGAKTSEAQEEETPKTDGRNAEIQTPNVEEYPSFWVRWLGAHRQSKHLITTGSMEITARARYRFGATAAISNATTAPRIESTISNRL